MKYLLIQVLLIKDIIDILHIDFVSQLKMEINDMSLDMVQKVRMLKNKQR